MVQEEIDKKTNDLQARHSVARDASGQSRNPNSKMPEDYVVFTSLNLMMCISFLRVRGCAHRKSYKNIETNCKKLRSSWAISTLSLDLV